MNTIRRWLARSLFRDMLAAQLNAYKANCLRELVDHWSTAGMAVSEAQMARARMEGAQAALRALLEQESDGRAKTPVFHFENEEEAMAWLRANRPLIHHLYAPGDQEEALFSDGPFNSGGRVGGTNESPA